MEGWRAGLSDLLGVPGVQGVDVQPGEEGVPQPRPVRDHVPGGWQVSWDLPGPSLGIYLVLYQVYTWPHLSAEDSPAVGDEGGGPGAGDLQGDVPVDGAPWGHGAMVLPGDMVTG